jgi:hypothetical protein
MRSLLSMPCWGPALRRDLSGAALDAVRAINASGLPVLAADTPSGLDTDTGLARPEAVRATQTVTFVAPKMGFHLGVGPDHVGSLHIDSLGIPESAYADAVSHVLPLFRTRWLAARCRVAHARHTRGTMGASSWWVVGQACPGRSGWLARRLCAPARGSSRW